jgi:hypothetical protein
MLLLQLSQQIHDLRAHAHIESRNRFIEDQEPGPRRARAGYIDALALSAENSCGWRSRADSSSPTCANNSAALAC